jgi:hypothetical protein
MIMSKLTDHLGTVLENLTRNLNHVSTNLDTAMKAVNQLDETSMASIKQLLDKWEHPQAISQFITAVAQAEGLTAAKTEMQAALALIQTGATKEDFLAEAQKQMEANEASANSPLSVAGQSGAAAAVAPAPQTNVA